MTGYLPIRAPFSCVFALLMLASLPAQAADRNPASRGWLDPVAQEETTSEFSPELGLQDPCCQEPGVCCEACDDLSPRWSFSADLMFLQRSSAPSSPLVYNATTGAPVLDASSLGQDVGLGPRLSLSRALASGRAFELAYWGVDGWGDSVTLPPGQYLLHADATASGPPATTALLFQYQSRIHTVEANLWLRDRCWLRPMVGARWLRLGESFNFQGGFDAGSSIIDFDGTYRTRNDLFGPQIGALGMLWDKGGRLTVSTTAKAGIYLNDATMRIHYVQSEFLPGGEINNSRSQTALAFLGELGLTAQWRFNDTWSLRAGYQLYWLEGVALAPDQQTEYMAFDNQGGPVTSGGLFLHGSFVGLQASW